MCRAARRLWLCSPLSCGASNICLVWSGCHCPSFHPLLAVGATHRGRKWGVCFLVVGSWEKRCPFTHWATKQSVGRSRPFLFSVVGGIPSVCIPLLWKKVSPQFCSVCSPEHKLWDWQNKIYVWYFMLHRMYITQLKTCNYSGFSDALYTVSDPSLRLEFCIQNPP